MFEPNRNTLRGIMAASCLVVLAACSAGKNVASSSTVTPPTGTVQAAPPAPSDLKGTAGNAKANLSWSSSSGAASYNVKRSATSGGPYAQLAVAMSSAYTDASVSNGDTYFYVVAAVNTAGESPDSAQTSVTPDPSITTPATPAGLAAKAGSAQVSLTWTASTGAASYNVKRSTTSGGPYKQIGAPTAASYTDSSVTNGTIYYYIVSAVDSAGESANSSQVSAAPVAAASIPAVPMGLSAGAGNGSVNLNWSASSGATSYHVKRATASGGPYTQVGAPTSAFYTDSSLSNGTAYYYVVSAVDSAGESANSAQASATPAAPTSNPPPTTLGAWVNVSPSNVDLLDSLDCVNVGTITIQPDPANPGDVYTEFGCQGVWKSTDYGLTWTGPISTGSNSASANDCAGGITIAPSSTASVPTIYESCIRGNGTGFWRSTDGGVNWTSIHLTPLPSNRQDVYPPVADPYDPNHLLMAGHEQDYILESTDAGLTWSNVPLASGMLENGGTAAIFFINTGSAATTRKTWLWMGQQSGGAYGTWRTTSGGSSAVWTRVDSSEHTHGAEQIYQPDTSGVVYMPGAYSASGWGLVKSTDYGQTWSHVGITANLTSVIGTPKNIYSFLAAGGFSPTYEVAAQPGTGTWLTPSIPSGIVVGATQMAVVNDGTHNIIIGAFWGYGVWRYIEP